jgi:hypothetical protein
MPKLYIFQATKDIAREAHTEKIMFVFTNKEKARKAKKAAARSPKYKDIHVMNTMKSGDGIGNVVGMDSGLFIEPRLDTGGL